MNVKHKKCIIFPVILIWFLGIFLLASCASLSGQTRPTGKAALTPIIVKPTHEYHPGKLVWHDLITPDSNASKAFYGELFDWVFKEHGQYVQIYSRGKLIGGIVQIKPKEGQKAVASWLASMSVPNVKEAISYIKGHGGKIVNGPVDMPNRGVGALIKDPQGAYLVVLHAKDGDPIDKNPEIGDWLWNEMWTLNLDKAVDFYKGLGKYESTLRHKDYTILLNEGKWRAGVRLIKQKKYSGRWVPVVRVEDPKALLRKVEKLGGLVLVRPGEKSARETTALIADNMGALLILQSWSFPE